MIDDAKTSVIRHRERRTIPMSEHEKHVLCLQSGLQASWQGQVTLLIDVPMAYDVAAWLAKSAYEGEETLRRGELSKPAAIELNYQCVRQRFFVRALLDALDGSNGDAQTRRQGRETVRDS